VLKFERYRKGAVVACLILPRFYRLSYSTRMAVQAHAMALYCEVSDVSLDGPSLSSPTGLSPGIRHISAVDK
jgi:hypothetical protein